MNGHTIDIVTSGGPHCVVSLSKPNPTQGKHAVAHIMCACGVVFTHRETFEAAKAWYEHSVFRDQLRNSIKEKYLANREAQS